MMKRDTKSLRIIDEIIVYLLCINTDKDIRTNPTVEPS